MNSNPILHKLGFAPNDRLAIIHTDDIGMCQASVDAFAALHDFGLISSGAVMVPCPWFLHAARMLCARSNVDIGVHLTLTSEWKTYRWGPLSTRDPATGLLDAQGYFHHDSPQVHAAADPEAVRIEIKAQFERALAAGLRPTHADTHMGTLGHFKFMPAYIQLALQYRVPPMVFRLDEAGWQAVGLDLETAAVAARTVQRFEADGLPLLDGISMLPLDQPDNRFEQAKAAFAALPPGVTHFILHPSVDTPELRAIAPDWRARVADFETFRRDDLRDYIKEIGVQVIGYKQIQDLMP